MNPKMNRRNFIKTCVGVGTTIIVGGGIPRLLGSTAFAATQTLNITITDAIKGMVTDQDPALNPEANIAECYFWVYRMKADGADIPSEVPGPIIIATEGASVDVEVTNELDEDHEFTIPGIFTTGVIVPGGTFNGTITIPPGSAGPYMYLDDRNRPVNRVMGLHGAFIIMPDVPAAGHKFTPYGSPTLAVQDLFDDFGDSAHYPGLAWEEDAVNPGITIPGSQSPVPNTPAFRQYIWLLHQASPNLFARVGDFPAKDSPGSVTGNFPAADFVKDFLKDAFAVNNNVNTGATPSDIPMYFTINGQSGHFSHNNPFICPNLRCGEPCVVHVMNAGLMSHSMHLHANHFYVTLHKGEPVNPNGVAINGVAVNPDGVAINPIWIDVYGLDPMAIVDYVIPYMRVPDVPNFRGIGNPDILSGADKPLKSLKGLDVWPPVEELALVLPKIGTTAGDVSIAVQLSPICYPMHDHSEPSQTAQGGNYNLGMISGMNITGDRNLAVVTTFDNPPADFGPDRTKLAQLAAGPE